jgi:TRAP transporter TAXI family solute receptor
MNAETVMTMDPRKLGFSFMPMSALVALVLSLAPAFAADTLAERANRGLVEIITGSISGTSVRTAEDLADVLDDGATRRVLPVIGKGSVQDLVDVRAVRGVDLAIVQTDVLDYAKAQKIYPGIENSFTYIAKLYNEELHILARADVRNINDLVGKRVNFGPQGDGTSITGPRVFDLLKLRVEATSFTQAMALEKLRSGEISAMVFVAGKPAPIFEMLRPRDNFHFLGVPLRPEIASSYIPARLTNADYPNIVGQQSAVDTIAVGTALIVANLYPDSERYKNAANFVDAFFTQFPRLQEAPHHPKWNEVNLAAELPNWKRFAPAADWIKRNGGTPVAMSEDTMRDVFAKFLDERTKSGTSGATLTAEQKDQLFDQFKRWQSGQAH